MADLSKLPQNYIEWCIINDRSCNSFFRCHRYIWSCIFLSFVFFFLTHTPVVHKVVTPGETATSAKSISRRRAARIWRTSPQLVCPATWTYLQLITKHCSAPMSVSGQLCLCTQRRHCTHQGIIKQRSMETGKTGIDHNFHAHLQSHIYLH